MTDPRAYLAEHGMYRPEFETDACGVGMIAATDGQPSRRVVRAGIEALKADMGEGWLKVFNQSHMSMGSTSPSMSPSPVQAKVTNN